MALHGKELLERTIALAQAARRRLQAIPGIDVLDGSRLGIARYDLTKLVVDVHGIGMTGFEVEESLRRRFAIQPEMSDLVGVVCLVTVGDTTISIDRLVTAFETLAAEGGRTIGTGAAMRSSGAILTPGIQAMSPRDAYFAQTRTVPLQESTGEVSAELVIPYPPGIPVLAPGDVIAAETVDYLRTGAAHGMYLSGPADPALTTIRVVAAS